MHILIVEDDVISGTLLENLLKPHGTTVSVMTGNEVLPTFEKARNEKQPFDLICLDIMLPGMDGLVHISEMSWTKRVNHPSEVFAVGDEVTVKVLKYNPETKMSAIKSLQRISKPGLRKYVDSNQIPMLRL